MKQYGAKGGRRLRFAPRIEIGDGSDENGPYLQLAFELDSGCYATTARELMKEVS